MSGAIFGDDHLRLHHGHNLRRIPEDQPIEPGQVWISNRGARKYTVVSYDPSRDFVQFRTGRNTPRGHINEKRSVYGSWLRDNYHLDDQPED